MQNDGNSDEYSVDDMGKNESYERSLKRMKFSKEEDILLVEQVNKYGPRKWNIIAQALPGRTSRQCRDRYMNYLEAGLTNEPWSSEDDRLLEHLFTVYGTKWSLISKHFNGRSSNNIKNRWYTHLQKRFKYKHRHNKIPHQPKIVTKPKLPSFTAEFGEISKTDQFLYEIKRIANLAIPDFLNPTL